MSVMQNLRLGAFVPAIMVSNTILQILTRLGLIINCIVPAILESIKKVTRDQRETVVDLATHVDRPLCSR